MTEPVSLVTKVSMMLVSLVLSFGLWVYVQYVQPEGSQYGTVPIAAQNTEAFSSRYIFPDLGDAYVRIEGPQDQLKDDAAVKRVLRENRVFVWVDFKTAQQGTRMYPVNIVSSHESPFTFSLANKTVRVDIEAKLTRRLPVNIDATGEIPRELNLSYDGASADPNMGTIDGPASAVRRVKRVRAFLDLGGVAQGGTTEVSLDTLDDNDQQVSDVAVHPQAVTIRPKVSAAAQSANAFIEPTFEGHPAIGFTMTNYSVEPTQIAVQGPPELLANLRKITTSPINLDGLRSTTTVNATLNMPPGTKSNTTKTVKVIVTVEPSQNSGGASQSFAGPQ